MVVPTYNQTTQKAEAGSWKIQAQAGLQRKFYASLVHILSQKEHKQTNI